MALDPKQLQSIVESVTSLDIEEIREAMKDAEEILNSVPEGHWMKGMLGVSLVSMQAMLEYRLKLEEIKDDLLAGVTGAF